MAKWTRNFVGARGIEAMVSFDGSVTSTAFPLYDCHGNMVATVARSGSGFVTGNVRTYDVWGSVRNGAATGGPRGRYVANLGHVQDDESGLIYMRARFYEPGSGRFLSEDPARDGRNWLSFVANNPIKFSDFTGKNLNALMLSLFQLYPVFASKPDVALYISQYISEATRLIANAAFQEEAWALQLEAAARGAELGEQLMSPIDAQLGMVGEETSEALRDRTAQHRGEAMIIRAVGPWVMNTYVAMMWLEVLNNS